MMKTEYLTLEELRGDKAKLGKVLRKELKSLQDDVVECVMPQQTQQLINSDVPYARYLGYGWTAWKTFSTVKRVMTFLKKRW